MFVRQIEAKYTGKSFLSVKITEEMIGHHNFGITKGTLGNNLKKKEKKKIRKGE
jgi:ribosomal protein S19